MNKEQYLNKRNELLNKAHSLVNEGKINDANLVTDEIKNLDADFEKAAKAQANITALQGSVPVVDLENKSVKVLGAAIDSTGGDAEKKDSEDPLYLTAWAKHLMNRSLNDNETSVMELTNKAITTGDGAVLIPETVVKGIWKEIGEQYPLYQDILKTNVKGLLSVLKSESSSDAKWYEEDDETEDGADTFGNATLKGCELSRSVTVSWKMREMSVEEFIPFIQGQLAEKMGAAAAYGAFEGKGPAAADDSTAKDEPKGIKTVLMSGAAKQVVAITGEPSYDDIAKMVSLVKGAYKKGAKFYAKGEFIWNTLAKIKDANERPYFVPDPVAGGVGRMLGFVVEEDDSVDTLLFGNANKGYHMNVNKPMTLDQEDHKKKRNTDYIAYAIMDGDVRSEKAFSYMKITKA